jgi:hypothetical protein
MNKYHSHGKSLISLREEVLFQLIVPDDSHSIN